MDLLKGALSWVELYVPNRGTPDSGLPPLRGSFRARRYANGGVAFKASGEAGLIREKPDDHIASPLQKVFADQEAIDPRAFASRAPPGRETTAPQ